MATIKNGGAVNNNITTNGERADSATITNGYLSRKSQTPNSDDSPDGYNGGGINNLGNGGGNNNGDGGDEPGSGSTNTANRYGGKGEDRGREFILVKSNNIIIQTFSGKNLSSNPYLPFNKSLKRLTYNQGADGEHLLEILEEVEGYGATKFDNGRLQELIRARPKAAEYNRALLCLLLKYTTSIAKGMVEHGVDNGFDAWRRLYHHHIPLAEDLGKIIMQELYSLRPVSEGEIDSLFNEVERITELYLKASVREDPMLEEWIMAAIIRNLPKQITKDLALELKKAKSIDDIHNTINIYMHDHQAGMPRNMPGPMLYLTEPENSEEATSDKAAKENPDFKDVAKNMITESDKKNNGDWDLYATTKGAKGNGKGLGKGKGYGECWHCGEWGHPRRECPLLHGQQGPNGVTGSVKRVQRWRWQRSWQKG